MNHTVRSIVKAMKVCFAILGSLLDKTFYCTSKSRPWNHILFIDQDFRKGFLKLVLVRAPWTVTVHEIR